MDNDLVQLILNNGVAIGVMVWFMVKHDKTLTSLIKSIDSLTEFIKNK